MRLVCPKCEAKYEVPDDAIPDSGRDVQCANCGHAWFQARTRTTAPATAPGVPVPPARPATARPDPAAYIDSFETAEAPARVPDEKVLTILREEAEREAKARREKTRPLGYQTDLGIEQVAAPRAKAPQPGVTPGPVAARAPETVVAQKMATRRDLLPDVEAIKSTLQPVEEPEPEFVSAAYPGAEEQDGRGAFRSGFLLVLTIAILGASAYTTAPWLAAKLPALSDPLARYVVAVDDLRLQLDELVRQATQLIAKARG